eukprot:Lithocolla_globosa_v1_NODE_1670_length_2408_cov_13.956226.p3 type:complete len:115 gc:universal NODE_1670_length_2408_cov_13.956226:1671-2015(+)
MATGFWEKKNPINGVQNLSNDLKQYLKIFPRQLENPDGTDRHFPSGDISYLVERGPIDAWLFSDVLKVRNLDDIVIKSCYHDIIRLSTVNQVNDPSVNYPNNLEEEIKPYYSSL